jgi:linoleoyl-CoA desaturase
MKNIRFLSADKRQFANAVKKNVNDYFKENHISDKGNWKMVVKLIVMLSLYLVPFVIVLVMPINDWLALALTVVMGIGLAGTGMSVMHDAVHEAFSEKKWVNKLLGATMYLLGSSVFTWKVQHNFLHHTYTNIAGYDEDIKSRVVLRMSPHTKLRWIHRFQYVYFFLFYSLMTLSKLVGDFMQLNSYNKKGLTKQQQSNPAFEYIRMALVKIVYLVVVIGLPLYFTDFTWWQIVIGFLSMHLTAGLIMSVVFQLAHVVEGTTLPLPNESGNIENEWAIHQVLTTSDFARQNLLLGWYIGGLNFQIEHHLFPNICHIHYRKISYIVEKTAKEFNIAYNLKPSFGDAFMSHVRMLKKFGTA